jgi:hypothetical protein
MKWVLVAFVLFSNGVFAQGQRPIEIGTIKGNRIAVSAGAGNYRVGNAALVRLLTIQENSLTSTGMTLLVACDGSWISDSIQFAAQFNTKPSFAEIEEYSRANDETLPLARTNFTKIAESTLYFAEPLARKASAICKTASREPRNVIIPVAGYKEKDDLHASVALVLGTSVKRGDVIDIWMRTTWYKRVPILDTNGFELKSPDGEVMANRKVTGKYSLDQTAYDCRNRTMGVFQSAEYESSTSTPVSQSVPREKLRLSSVIPGSVGEAQLEAVCRLYASNPL